MMGHIVLNTLSVLFHLNSYDSESNRQRASKEMFCNELSTHLENLQTGSIPPRIQVLTFPLPI